MEHRGSHISGRPVISERSGTLRYAVFEMERTETVLALRADFVYDKHNEGEAAFLRRCMAAKGPQVAF